MKKVILTTQPTNVLQEKFVDITLKWFGQNQQKLVALTLLAIMLFSRIQSSVTMVQVETLTENFHMKNLILEMF
jgi:hypothetical protein